MIGSRNRGRYRQGKAYRLLRQGISMRAMSEVAHACMAIMVFEVHWIRRVGFFSNFAVNPRKFPMFVLLDVVTRWIILARRCFDQAGEPADSQQDKQKFEPKLFHDGIPGDSLF